MTLIRKWFDQIAYGVKTEEYREIKPYWTSKLENRRYDVIVFRNGYSPTAPLMEIEFLGVEEKIKTWDTGKTELVYAIRLGRILKIENYDGKKELPPAKKRYEQVFKKKSRQNMSTY